MAREDIEDAIIAYKSILAQIIDNRPSGTRQRLATALGKHRSFVTQITSPTYATPPFKRAISRRLSASAISALPNRSAFSKPIRPPIPASCRISAIPRNCGTCR